MLEGCWKGGPSRGWMDSRRGWLSGSGGWCTYGSGSNHFVCIVIEVSYGCRVVVSKER